MNILAETWTPFGKQRRRWLVETAIFESTPRSELRSAKRKVIKKRRYGTQNAWARLPFFFFPFFFFAFFPFFIFIVVEYHESFHLRFSAAYVTLPSAGLNVIIRQMT
jgi:hypothetical protein